MSILIPEFIPPFPPGNHKFDFILTQMSLTISKTIILLNI